jgi:hypothetical protein
VNDAFDHDGNTFEPSRPWQPATFVVVVTLSAATVIASLSLAWFMIGPQSKQWFEPSVGGRAVQPAASGNKGQQ